jgi:hypothetical protein
MIQCMWIISLPDLVVKDCLEPACCFRRERDGVLWAWCEKHKCLAGHSGGEVEITRQEYLIAQVHDS